MIKVNRIEPIVIFKVRSRIGRIFLYCIHVVNVFILANNNPVKYYYFLRLDRYLDRYVCINNAFFFFVLNNENIHSTIYTYICTLSRFYMNKIYNNSV